MMGVRRHTSYAYDGHTPEPVIASYVIRLASHSVIRHTAGQIIASYTCMTYDAKCMTQTLRHTPHNFIIFHARASARVVSSERLGVPRSENSKKNQDLFWIGTNGGLLAKP